MHDMAPQAEITEETEQMILKALAKDPDHRQQSMEEFHRDLQKCYGQIRFRRTLKTPRVQVTDTTDTPPVQVIHLTRKKPAPPGAIPTGLRSSQSPSIDLQATFDLGQSPPTLVDAVPTAGADNPILLTKKKPRRETTPPPAESAPPRKRTTLPLGIEGSQVAGRVPSSSLYASAPTATHESVRPPTPPADAPRAVVAPMADRPTPRVPVRSSSEDKNPSEARVPAPIDAAETSWVDEPTSPGVTQGTSELGPRTSGGMSRRS
jgi:hypothetical protein